MQNYRLIKKKGEGTFSQVIKAQNIQTGKYVAIKCMKNVFKSIEQVNNLREIQALRKLTPHSNIVTLYDVLFDQPTGQLCLVFELMDRNLYECIKGKSHYLPESTIKKWIYQVLVALEHMHKNGIFHRDIKPENILIRDNEIKLADFGSCRGINSRKPFTEYISTRWYRAPECLLTDGWYSYFMDIWGVGCVLFELMSLYPLFPGTNEIDQIKKIHIILGTPSKIVLDKFHHKSAHVDFRFPYQEGRGIKGLLPHASKNCVDLIEKMLEYDPDTRLTAKQSLQHPWFIDIIEPSTAGTVNPFASTPSIDDLSAEKSIDMSQPSISNITSNLNITESTNPEPNKYMIHSGAKEKPSAIDHNSLPQITNTYMAPKIKPKTKMYQPPLPYITGAKKIGIVSKNLDFNNLKYDTTSIGQKLKNEVLPRKKKIDETYMSPYSQKYITLHKVK